MNKQAAKKDEPQRRSPWPLLAGAALGAYATAPLWSSAYRRKWAKGLGGTSREDALEALRKNLTSKDVRRASKVVPFVPRPEDAL